MAEQATQISMDPVTTWSSDISMFFGGKPRPQASICPSVTAQAVDTDIITDPSGSKITDLDLIIKKKNHSTCQCRDRILIFFLSKGHDLQIYTHSGRQTISACSSWPLGLQLNFPLQCMKNSTSSPLPFLHHIPLPFSAPAWAAGCMTVADVIMFNCLSLVLCYSRRREFQRSLSGKLW